MKNLGFLQKKKQSLFTPSYYFYLPSAWSFYLLGSKTPNSFKIIYFYSNFYTFKIGINSQNINLTFDKQTSVLYTKNLTSYPLLSLYTHFVKIMFYSFSKIFFKKLKFKGKGYYIYKNKRNTITPQFGYAHRIYVYAFFVYVKFLSKTSIFLFGYSKKDLNFIGLLIKKMKPINIFTGRGVRFNRQITYKKVGKVSTYR